MIHYFYSNYMIIDIIMILKCKLLIPYITRVSVFGTHVRIRTPCVIIQKPYIPLDKLYSIDESIRQFTIKLFIINFMTNIF